MTDQECDELYQKIIVILRHKQLTELVDRTVEQVAEGKIVTEDVKTFTEVFDSAQGSLFPSGNVSGRMKPASKSKLPVVVPYSSQERLEILIDVIEQALITPVEIEHYLAERFLPTYSFEKLIFTSEDGKQATVLDIDDEAIHAHQFTVSGLRKALATLKKEL